MHTPKIDLTISPAGRHLAFSKELLGMAHVFRRVGGEAGRWLRVAVNYHSPYIDTDAFAPGTQLEYYVQHETQQGVPEVRSHVVGTTIGVGGQAFVSSPNANAIPLSYGHEHTRPISLLPPFSGTEAGS